jgi:hypothetical protein
MTHEEIERGMLFNSLANIGEFIKLKMYADPVKLEQDLEQFKDNWCPYNVKKDSHNNRWGLPVTSHTGDVMDNYHLNSFGYMQQYHDVEMKEENFNIPTQVYNALPQIQPIIDMFKPDIGRVHFLRIGAGGFFPPHIDHFGACPDYVRLITVFGKCKPENFVQLIDGKPTYFDPGYFYWANFQREHSVFSFSDHVYSLILTVKLTQRTHDIILKNGMNVS